MTGLGPSWARPSPTIGNTEKVLYITDNIRFRKDAAQDFAQLESRVNGTWNLSTLIFDSGSVKLGEATVSAAFAYLEVEAPGELAALIPHIEFDTTGTKLVHTPVLDALTVFQLAINPDSQIVGTVIGEAVLNDESLILDDAVHKVGSVGATSQVTYTVYEGADNTGAVKFTRNFPASDFAADAEPFIDFKRALGVVDGEEIFIEMKSDELISLRIDSSGNLITTINAFPLAELGIITENIVLDNALNMTFDNDLNPTYGNQF